MKRFLPCLVWIRSYNRSVFTSDLIAAAIVTVMLIPQSLAYALLAGLPPETGLYASILPLLAYAVFGTSRTLAVGPVAVASLMTAAAIGSQDILPPAEAAMWLAIISGVFLAVMGIVRFGFLANFLSHPVVSGFITASGVIIALSQVKHLLGVSASGDNLPELLHTLGSNITNTNGLTLLMGMVTLGFLFWTRRSLANLLKKIGLSPFAASAVSRVAPVVAVIVTSLLAWYFRLDQHGMKLMGEIPGGLPSLTVPGFSLDAIKVLALPAILISIIGYVESVSVGRTLASRRRQKIDPDQELIGLGAANLASGISGGFPVTGGFSRSVVNFDAGAQTQAASVLTAGGIAAATLLLSSWLAWLPNVTLAATIIVAVLSLVDFSILRASWNYSRSDFIAVALTMGVTLLWGVELGVSCGVGVSLFLHLYKTSRPHIAEVGEVEGTGHFRNVKRHKVVTHPAILTLRIDESLYFANASYIEDEIFRVLQERPAIRHVVLMCTAVNEIDISALEVLEEVNERLRQADIGFNLSEVKGPVMDHLRNTHLLKSLHGSVFLSQQLAMRALVNKELTSAQIKPGFQDFQI